MAELVRALLPAAAAVGWPPPSPAECMRGDEATGLSRRPVWAHVAAAIAAVLLTLLAGCSTLPDLQARPVSHALQDTGSTGLGKAIASSVQAHPGLSGILPLPDGYGAFAARAALAEAAQRSLDVQYYIWRTDLSGTLLFEALRRAAGRGVRVRLLLDDINTNGMDGVLAALDTLPNFEVRLFNPVAQRTLRAAGYLLEFSRLNRRMHNKSFTADNQVTIVGGRNVGDEYFGAHDELLFTDLDVAAVGPVVKAVSDDFDRYWASASAYPVRGLLLPAEPGAADAFAARAAQVERSQAAQAYIAAVASSPFVHQLSEGELPFEWTTVRMVSDDPAKGLGQPPADGRVPLRLEDALGTPQRELQLISSYFVPMTAGTQALAELTRQGVSVKVLTNSLEATDVTLVHAGYAKYRRALLAAGVQLFELKGLGQGQAGSSSSWNFSGSSAASLHAKTFAVDRERVYVGSFNFDPRSIRLNTELGLVIDSPALAGRIADAFVTVVPQRSYELRLNANGALNWLERRGGELQVHESEPLTGPWQRAAIRLLSLLPIDELL